MQFSLRDVLKGQCRDVCPRMCKKDPNSLSSDYKCGFVCQNVCSSSIRKRRSRRSTSSTNHMHMTPLPSKMKFFDIDNDGVVNLFEFARALGHNPRKQHVVRAFKAADLDDDEKLDFFEFNNDVWVTDQDVVDDNYEFEINEDTFDSEFDEDSDESSGKGSDSDDTNSDSSKDDSDDSSDSSDDSKDSDSDSSDDSKDSDNDSSKDSKDSDRKGRRRGKKGSKKGRKSDTDGDGVDSVDVDGIDGPDGLDGFDMPAIDMPEAGGEMMENFGEMGEQMSEGFENIGGDMADGMGDIGDAVGDGIDAMKDAAGDGVDTVGDAVDGMKDTLDDTADAMTGGVNDAVDGMKDVMGDVVDAAADGMDAAADVVDNVVDGMTDNSNLALAAMASSGSGMPPPPPINVADDSFVQPISAGVGSNNIGSSITSGSNGGTSLNSMNILRTTRDEQTSNTAGNRVARWQKVARTRNMLLPPRDLSKGQPGPRVIDDSMTTSFVRTPPSDGLGLFRSVAPIRVRVPAFANFGTQG
ncbi:unnamed protein product [Mytilus coruscus]|uniref:EF-hand domain-containing protein n=1 Tax=Mytilus coruscus TaxID=42192 RepID=A0A6J8E784_MYTCO|nr:unnamed protein product [Mytilus coruscus]